MRLSWKLTAAFLSLGLVFFIGACSKQSKGNNIVVWHWMSDRQAAFDELAKRYQAATGKKVVFELYAPSEAYSQKVRAAAQSGTLPEVYGILSETRDFASFVQSGHVENLSSAMNDSSGAWKNVFYPKALANSTFLEGNSYQVPAGIYGVPIDVMTIQMVYNKRLLKEAGLNPEQPPKTWNEFLAATKALRKNNVPAFVSGWGELWMIECMATSYAIHVMGEEKFFKTLKGELPYTTPEWLQVLDLFDQMRQDNVLFEGAVTMVNKTAEQTFANERAAFALNGSWCVNVYEGMNPKLEYGAMIFPTLRAQNPMKVWGGAGSTFVVNAKSSKKAETVEFLKWLTAKDQQAYLAEATKNLPANREASSKISPVLASFSAALENTTHPSQWPLHENPVVNEMLLKGIQSILIGEKKPKQVAEEVEKFKQKELSQKK